MERYRTESVPGVRQTLVIYECPLDLLERAVELASDSVTVENLAPDRVHRWSELTLQLYPEDVVRTRSVRSAQLDVAMDRDEFRRHLPFWDQNGVYAVFTRRGPVAFRASELDDVRRYRALANYEWTLELAIPGPSGGEWGSISTPDDAIFQRILAMAEAHVREESGG